MHWVEVEADTDMWSPVAGCVGFVIVAIAWWYGNFWLSLFILYAIVLLIHLTVGFWRSAYLPKDAWYAGMLVEKWFREHFPEKRVESVAVRAVEPQRFVISVRYTERKIVSYPIAREYFAIDRPSLSEVTELPKHEWWPRGLK
jgi:hypothetical protein